MELDPAAGTRRSPSRSAGAQMFDIESPLAIELRRIMLRLSRQLDLDRKHCLMVTSAQVGEGKSLFSLYFSLILSYHLKQKICLVDGDIRRPVQHKVFQVPRAPGVSDYLSSSTQAEISVHRTPVENLSFLPAGIPAERPSRLFSNSRFQMMIAALRRHQDIIIVDAPPVVPVSDPLHYAEAMDGVIYLIMAGKTHRDVAYRGLEILRGAGANILGVVANNLSQVLPYYYDRKYYGYQRGSKRS